MLLFRFGELQELNKNYENGESTKCINHISAQHIIAHVQNLYILKDCTNCLNYLSAKKGTKQFLIRRHIEIKYFFCVFRFDLDFRIAVALLPCFERKGNNVSNYRNNNVSKWVKY